MSVTGQAHSETVSLAAYIPIAKAGGLTPPYDKNLPDCVEIFYAVFFVVDSLGKGLYNFKKDRRNFHENNS